MKNVNITFICKAQEKEQEMEIFFFLPDIFFFFKHWRLVKTLFLDCYTDSGETAMMRCLNLLLGDVIMMVQLCPSVR